MRAGAFRLTLVALVALAALLTGCTGGGNGPADDGASLGSPGPATPVTAPELPAPSSPGTGVVLIGGSPASFAVSACQLTAGPPAAEPTILKVTGEGTTGGGIPFKVEVLRTATAGAAETFTDTVTYSDSARILQVQRFEVNGAITDLRQASARGPLLQVHAADVAATGLAGPPGSVAGDEGIVGLAIDATCS